MMWQLSLRCSPNVLAMIENAKQSYWRADIQGLRALAVIAVIAYHSGLPIKSGFLGVDVFIVVSGYVITGLLLREIESTGSIRIWKFFKWRFLRLFPAHVVMLATTLMIFFFIGPYGAHKAALNQARASVAFLANGYFFARSKDYFALGDDLTLFLNTWSLALEEQFYAIFAVVISLLIFIVNRSGRNSIRNLRNSIIWLVVILIVISIIAALISSMVWSGEGGNFKTSTINPRAWLDFLVSRGTDFAFYSPVTRAWQFLVGALVALMSFEKTEKVKSMLANLAIVVLVLVLTFASAQATVFFSWSRISATFLTAFIIVRSSKVLANKLLVLIGDRSYSLYLWHYPLIVISRSIDSGLASGIALVSVVFFSELSFRYIETPFRHSNRTASKNFGFLRIVPTSLVLISVCVVFLRLDVVAKDMIDPSHFVAESADSQYFYDETSNCWSDDGELTCGDELNGSILLVGDSHAGSLRPGFFKAISSINLSPRYRDGRCLFASFDRDAKSSAKSGCDELGIQLQREIISQKPRIVVFLICGRIHDSCPEGLDSESEEDWVNAGKRALQPILDAGVSIALVRDLPVLTPDPRYAASVVRSIFDMPINSFKIDKNYQRISQSRFESLFSELTSSSGELFEVQFLDSVCIEDSCKAKTRTGADIWQDADHLSINGSIEIADVIAREVSLLVK